LELETHGWKSHGVTGANRRKGWSGEGKGSQKVKKRSRKFRFLERFRYDLGVKIEFITAHYRARKKEVTC